MWVVGFVQATVHGNTEICAQVNASMCATEHVAAAYKPCSALTSTAVCVVLLPAAVAPPALLEEARTDSMAALLTALGCCEASASGFLCSEVLGCLAMLLLTQ